MTRKSKQIAPPSAQREGEMQVANKSSKTETKVIGKDSGFGYERLSDTEFLVPPILADIIDKATMDEAAAKALVVALIAAVQPFFERAERDKNHFWDRVLKDIANEGMEGVYHRPTRTVRLKSRAKQPV